MTAEPPAADGALLAERPASLRAAITNAGVRPAAAFTLTLLLNDAPFHTRRLDGLAPGAIAETGPIPLGAVAAGWNNIAILTGPPGSAPRSRNGVLYQRQFFWRPEADLSPPETSVPQDGSRLRTMDVALSWQRPDGALHEHLQVTPAFRDGPGVDLIRPVEPDPSPVGRFAIAAPRLGHGPYVLLPDMTYTWRVRTAPHQPPLSPDDARWGPWSVSRTFRTPPRHSGGIAPAAPPDGGSIAAAAAKLQWRNDDPDVFSYDIEVGLDPALSVSGMGIWANAVHGGLTDPLNSWTPPPLLPGLTYYWRVRPRVQGDGAPVEWSPIWSFTAR